MSLSLKQSLVTTTPTRVVTQLICCVSTQRSVELFISFAAVVWRNTVLPQEVQARTMSLYKHVNMSGFLMGMDTRILHAKFRTSFK